MEVSSSLHFPSLISKLAKAVLTVAGIQLPAGDRADIDWFWFVRNIRVVAGLVWGKQGLENPKSGKQSFVFKPC